MSAPIILWQPGGIADLNTESLGFVDPAAPNNGPLVIQRPSYRTVTTSTQLAAALTAAGGMARVILDDSLGAAVVAPGDVLDFHGRGGIERATTATGTGSIAIQAGGAIVSPAYLNGITVASNAPASTDIPPVSFAGATPSLMLMNGAGFSRTGGGTANGMVSIAPDQVLTVYAQGACRFATDDATKATVWLQPDNVGHTTLNLNTLGTVTLSTGFLKGAVGTAFNWSYDSSAAGTYTSAPFLGSFNPTSTFSAAGAMRATPGFNADALGSLSAQSFLPNGNAAATSTTLTRGYLASAPGTFTKLYAGHIGDAANVGGQTISYELLVAGVSVASITGVTSANAGATVASAPPFSAPYNAGDLITVRISISALLTATLTQIHATPG
jgi:hypothetical protein